MEESLCWPKIINSFHSSSKKKCQKYNSWSVKGFFGENQKKCIGLKMYIGSGKQLRSLNRLILELAIFTSRQIHENSFDEI